MKLSLNFLVLVVPVMATIAFVPSGGTKRIVFPWKSAGLTERQAAVHLLSRFTYGARPGDVDAILRQGLENWFLQQLETDLPDDSLSRILNQYDALQLTNEQVTALYPRRAQVVRMAVKEGVFDKDSINKEDKKSYQTGLKAYMEEKGLKPQQELFRQFINQKILRAAYSSNQLQEIMTDFWFNHFNVSITKNNCAQYIPAYERDVIRPHALGKFDELLIATAQSPAMLVYLDNFSSSGNKGINENYAREVMELHTLGVDGGYTQKDVTEAARVFTGWTINQKAVFSFAMRRHDQGEKIVLGERFPAKGGYEEGVGLLNMLAYHPSTAQFLAKKIAIRFVSDNPPQSLVNKIAVTFRETKGDIKQVLLTMLMSKEFWAPGMLNAKTKSPFELAISAIRGMNGEIRQPYPLFSWISKMGQKIYYYQAPTGFPDNGQYWINTGALLERINFGLALASQNIAGTRVDTMVLKAGLHNNGISVGVWLGSPEFQRK